MHALTRTLALLLACPVPWAVGAPAAESTDAREAVVAGQVAAPRIGLVLSGGGARGLAHIGVLQVLEAERVPVHAIVGTSMGALVGGLYASGMTTAEIEALVRTLDWRAAFQDDTPRRDLDYRRKQEQSRFLVRLPVGFGSDGFRLPRGLIQGQKLTQVLRRETLPVAEITDFDRLPVPFRAVATDIETGEEVVLAGGDLTTALRASMSAPGVFTPVEVDDRLLVDGGLADNLPVRVAKSMGVDIVIAVDVGFKPQSRDELDSAIEMSNQMVAVMIHRETLRQRELLGPRDLVIEPDLGAMSSLDFTRVERYIERGRQAARGAVAGLAGLRVDADDWAQYQARHQQAGPPPPVVEFVRADEQSGRYQPWIDATLGDLVGTPVSARPVQRGLTRLYGDGVFETLDYRLVRDDGARAGLEIAARPKSWGPNYVRFGLELQDDFEGGNAFNAGVRFLFTEVNSFGGEWQVDLQVGEEPQVFTELYQPLRPAARWFVAPHASIERRSFDLIEADTRIAQYRVRSSEIGLDVGRELSSWGEMRLGVTRASGTSQLRIGDSSGSGLPERVDFERGDVYARFGLDRLDSVYFPRHGESFTLEWTGGREALGGDYDNEQLAIDWLVARSRGRSSWVLWLTGGTTLEGPQDAVQDFYTLGGLFNLSGRVADSLSGPHFAIARALYYRRIGRGGPGFLNVPTYAGLSLELGNVWQRRSDIGTGSALLNGALFVGLDTPLGPVYVAAGVEEGGGSSFYLLLGGLQ